MALSKKSMSAHQLHRMLGTSYEAAWSLFHRLREAANDIPGWADQNHEVEQFCNEIDTAKKAFQEQAKSALNPYVHGNLEEVLIYGSRAEIKLKASEEKEFKISEFLQSDFCTDHGISEFYISW